MPRKKKSKAKIADPGPTLTTGKNGAIYLNSTSNAEPYFAEWDGPARFDPKSVNWADLVTLYQDDPLLAAVFEQMKEWSEKDSSFFGTDYKYQWTLNGPGSTSSTTSNVLSNSFTLVYDSAGNASITEDK